MENLLFIPGVSENMECLLYICTLLFNGYLFAVLCCAKTPKYQKLSLMALISISFIIAGVRYWINNSEFTVSLLMFLTFSFGNYIIFLWRSPQRKLYKEDQEFKKRIHLKK
jgi:prepilin signal peptidase PulO-like enzyme (type II secretory pathway)